MPSVLVSTKNHYVVWRIPKGVPLLAPEDSRRPGPEKPWSWYCYRNVLTYWDDMGMQHEIKGEDYEPDFERHDEVTFDDGGQWGVDSDEEDEKVCVDSCECENNSDNWNHCAECSHKCCDLGPNAEEGWTYDEDKEVWLCPDCCEGE